MFHTVAVLSRPTINQSTPVVKYTCNSICGAEYDICLDAIMTFFEKFLCIRNTVRCKMVCKRRG